MTWNFSYLAFAAPCFTLPALFLVPCVHGLLLPTKNKIGMRSSLVETRLKVNLYRSESPRVEIPAGFTPPEPRPLTITESTDLGGFITASAGLALRLATGAFVLGWKLDTIFAPEDGKYALKLGPFRIRDTSSVLDRAGPLEVIVLYDSESSPRCKRVREMMNLLDITYECRPCFGPYVDELLPCIMDPNVDRTIHGDGDIIEHLLKQYGPPTSSYDTKALWPITFEEFSMATSQMAIMLRDSSSAGPQVNSRPDNGSMKPLELWAYECSPFVRPVKEKLSALGLRHTVVSCSRGSKNRDRMIDKKGRFQVPYLVDPNTGVDMFEGAEIVKYLDAVYSLKG
jgi:glutathione S-transferase